MTIAWLWFGAGGVVQFPGAAAVCTKAVLVQRNLNPINPQKIKQQSPIFYLANLSLSHHKEEDGL